MWCPETKFIIYLFLILSISGCEIQKVAPSKPVKVEQKLPDIPPEPSIKTTPEMVDEYARIHQISNLKVAEFYLTHPVYAEEHPYAPTGEDIAFYERAFLEKVYPEFKNLAAEKGFMEARRIYMSNPPDGPGNRRIGSTKYVGIMQRFAEGAEGASTGISDPLLENDPAAVHYQEAMKLHAENRLDEAIENMEKAVEANPESPSLLYNLGIMYIEKGDDESATQYLKSTIKHIKSTGLTNVNLAIYPEVYVSASVNLGIIYTRRSMYAEAVEVLKEAIQFRPDDIDINRNLGNVYFAMGDMDNAAIQLRKCIKLDPNNAGLHNLIGLIYYSKELYDAALEEFQTAAKLYPGEKQFNYNIGLALIRLGRQEEADQAFKLASGFKEGEDAPQAFTKQIAENKKREVYNEGCAAMKRGELNRAIGLFEAVLEQDPNMAEAHINLGVCYRTRDDRKKEIHHFEEAVRLSPGMPDAHHNLGLAYSDARMYSQAIAEFRRAIELKSSSQDTHFQLGTVLYKTGEYNDAALEFEKCVQLSPDWFEAHFNLGSCYLKTGNMDKAIEHFAKTTQLKPNSAEAYYSLGAAYMNAKKYTEASVLFRKALELDPAHKQARIMLKELEIFGIYP